MRLVHAVRQRYYGSTYVKLWQNRNEKYTIYGRHFADKMWASAGMVMMNT